jgi:tRNA threonylcarbamoyladenosine biosynthesis protein TsaE
MVFYTKSPDETELVGKRLAKALEERKISRAVIALRGELGVGKTAFTRGFASELGISGVKSPTYTVVNEYRKGPVPLFHFDLYRLEDSDDGLDSIGFDHYVQSGHCILEWSEFLPVKPEGAVTVTITKKGEEARLIEIYF